MSHEKSIKKALKIYSKNRNHVSLTKLRKANITLPSIFHPKSPETVCNLPYGASQNVHREKVCGSKKDNLLRDRKTFTKEILVSFIAKHFMPFILVPHIISLPQQLWKDHKVLTSLSIPPSTASYY